VLVVALVAVFLGADAARWFYGYSSKSPSTGIIEVTMRSPMNRYATAFSLSASGRIRIVERDTGYKHQVKSDMTVEIGEREFANLLDDAVQCGLAVFDSEQRLTTLKKRGRFIPTDPDGSRVILTFNLDYLARGTGESITPYSHRILVSDAGLMARHFKDEKEYTCLDSLLQYLTKVYWQARDQQ